MHIEPPAQCLRSVWLHCPLCGASKHLRRAEDLPANATRIHAPCPDCQESLPASFHDAGFGAAMRAH